MWSRTVGIALWLVSLAGCVLWDSRPESAGIPTCGADGSVQDGGPCVCSSECGSGQCWEEATFGFPHGMCVDECTASRACESDEICSFGLCLPRCQGFRDCADTRICTKVDGEDGDGACLPLCQQDSDCHSGSCNLWSGTCLPFGASPVGATIAEPCTEDAQCRSGACVDGGCWSTCSVQAQVCPEDATCGRVAGDSGLCLLPCDEDQDCDRLGWTHCTEWTDGLQYCLWPE